MSSDNNHFLQAGTVIQNKWVILEFIGQGGMGEVYRAHQLNLKRDIALKIISREWLHSVAENEEEFELGLQRFRNEVLAMAQIRHPNLIQIYDYGSFSLTQGPAVKEIEYIIMEYIPGGSLRSTMSEDGFYPEEPLIRDWVIKYFLPVLDGVQALHTAGIIHRDLKPGNILMDGNIPRITDFGLARSRRIRPVTMSMDIKGTPAYMSPEHFMDLKRADHRSDIYSLGKILYESIDGKMSPDTIPFKSVHLSHTDNSPVFNKFDQIIQKATAEDRNQRYSSVEEFRSAVLETVSPGEQYKEAEDQEKQSLLKPLSRSWWVWGIIALAVLIVLAIILWHFFVPPGALNRIFDVSPPALSEREHTEPLESKTFVDKTAKPPSIITGKDGAKLHLIPAGELVLTGDLSTEPKNFIKINSFYMDETEVTNHQYAEFLNEVLSKVRVEEEVVKVDGVVYLFLGEVAKGYEPIIFKDEKFRVKDPIYHSHPVVRVTAFGAVAYAEHYGRQLPTAVEWLYASRKINNLMQGTSPASSQERVNSHMEMMHEKEQTSPSTGNQGVTATPTSVTQSQPNQYGIRGLDGNVDEWAIIEPLTSSQKLKESKYGVFPGVVGRLPWEAFKDVGFRTVIPVS